MFTSAMSNTYQNSNYREIKMSEVDETLEDRGEKYGASFLEQSSIAQNLKSIVRNSPNWPQMRVDMRESVDMICTKLSRICYGDPKEIDSWHDIQGYARLIEKELTGQPDK